MIVAYNVDVPMKRWPFANWLLVAATVIVSVQVWITQANSRLPDLDKLAGGDPVAAREERERIENLDKQAPRLALQRERFAVSQLFTYTFVHADIMHLVGNLIFLFCFGNAVDAKLGHAAFLALYAALGAAAGLAWLFFDRQGLYLVGASGAISGITGLFLVFYPRNFVRVFYMLGYAVNTFEIQSYWLIGAYMIMDLVGTLLLHGDGVAYVCHLGGQITGIAIGLILLEVRFARTETYEENVLQFLGFRPLDRPVYKSDQKKKKKRRRDDDEVEDDD